MTLNEFPVFVYFCLKPDPVSSSSESRIQRKKQKLVEETRKEFKTTSPAEKQGRRNSRKEIFRGVL
jgi:hypothetical protein